MRLLLSMKAMIWPKGLGKNTKYLLFRSAGCARESGIHEHRTTSILQMRVFIVSGPAPAGCPEMTTLVTGEFLPSLKADPALPDEPSVPVSIEGLIPSDRKPVASKPWGAERRHDRWQGLRRQSRFRPKRFCSGSSRS